jgi:phosphoglycerate dehydrogenase-like enzyme
MNLLITGAWPDAKNQLAQVEALGHNVVFMQTEKDGLPCEPEWIEGVVCNGLFLHHPISQFKNLRFIQLTSAGYDRVDMDYVREHSIEIHNAKGVYSIPMAEFAVCGVLSIYKQMRSFFRNQDSHAWEKNRGLKELFGKTATIVGCGSVGTECAKRFKAFGCRIEGINRSNRSDEAYDRIQTSDKLDEILPVSDVLILAVPLTSDTEKLIDRKRLELLPENAVIVNISRGKIIDETALAELLKSGRIAGAVLDVFENEPLTEYSPIWSVPNLIATPHNSFVSEGNARRLNDVVMSKLI